MNPCPSPLSLLALDFPPTRGGIQTLTGEIYSRLADLVQVAVAPALPPHDGGPAAPLAAGALPVVRTRSPAGTGWRTIEYLREAAAVVGRQPAPGLLHCNHLFAGYAGWWLWRRHRIPYVVWVHGEELTKSRHPAWTRASLGGARALFTNSDFTARLTCSLLRGKRIPPIYKIPLGAPTAWITAPILPQRTGPAATILTVARLCARDRYKGVDIAIQAVAELRRRGRHFRYRIVGSGDDRGYLERLAISVGVADAVEFLGAVPESELRTLYDACDIFLLCSREEPVARGLGFEGFGIVFLEANARGKPVVGGRSGGIPDAVADGETGLLVEATSPRAVADGLERLLLNPEWGARLGAQGRARVQTKFNWDIAAHQVRELHLRLCATEGSSPAQSATRDCLD